MSRSRPWALVALLIATLAPATAMAQPSERTKFSISLGGLYAVPMDSKVSGNVDGIGSGSYTGDVRMDNGVAFMIGVGYGKEIGFRGEVELRYEETDLGDTHWHLSYPDIPLLQLDLPLEGDVTSWGLMANGVYTMEAGGLRPYVGFGVGLARLDAEMEARSTEVSYTTEAMDGQEVSRPVSFDFGRRSEGDIVLGLSLLAGVGYPVSDNVEIRLGYRYFGTSNANFDGVKMSYASHNIESGILFRF